MSMATITQPAVTMYPNGVLLAAPWHSVKTPAGGATRPVCEHAQRTENVRPPVNLVEHDQPAERSEHEHWIGKPG